MGLCFLQGNSMEISETGAFIVNDIRNFVFGLAEAAVYGSCKSRKQKFVMLFTIFSPVMKEQIAYEYRMGRFICSHKLCIKCKVFCNECKVLSLTVTIIILTPWLQLSFYPYL